MTENINFIKNEFTKKGYNILSTLEKDITKKTRLDVQDEKGYLYNTSYEGIRNSIPSSFHMQNPHTIKNIILYASKLAPDITLLSKEYTKAADENLEWQCKNHHTFTTSWHRMQQSDFNCIACSMPNSQIKKEDFIEIIGDEYQLLSEYISISKDVRLKHICGHEYNVQPWNFLERGTRCGKCKRAGALKSTEDFKAEVFSLTGSEYTVLDNYQGAKIALNMFHETCQKSYPVHPSNFLSGKRCPHCSGLFVDQEDFENRVFDLVGEEYSVVGKYINNYRDIDMKHNICGYVYPVRPSHFTYSGTRCQLCSPVYTSEALLVEHLYNLLKNTGYSVSQQYWFNDCRGLSNNPYYFDVAVLNKNKVVLLIERHGRQHYEYIPFFHRNKQGFTNQQKRDKNKLAYCTENNIPILIIEASKTDIPHEISLVNTFLTEQSVIIK